MKQRALGLMCHSGLLLGCSVFLCDGLLNADGKVLENIITLLFFKQGAVYTNIATLVHGHKDHTYFDYRGGLEMIWAAPAHTLSFCHFVDL